MQKIDSQKYQEKSEGADPDLISYIEKGYIPEIHLDWKKWIHNIKSFIKNTLLKVKNKNK